MRMSIIPNVLTLSNLFLGVWAILLVIQGDQYADLAAILILVGMVLDGLDGRVARWLNAQSEFGKELDSLSDVVSFGVAPAVLIYTVALSQFGTAGIFIATMFPACGALRLARFNVQAKKITGYFVGLPITAAGGVVAALSMYHEALPGFLLPFFVLFLSFLMVSNIKYPNFKRFGAPKGAIWISMAIIGIVVAVAFFFPGEFPKMIVFPILLYAVWGFAASINRFFKRNVSNEDEYHADF
jgi:CDP-diacylglycerol--serine O-phosphatidyltransferase